MFYRYLLVVAAVVLRFRSFDSVYGPQIHRVNREECKIFVLNTGSRFLDRNVDSEFFNRSLLDATRTNSRVSTFCNYNELKCEKPK